MTHKDAAGKARNRRLAAAPDVSARFSRRAREGAAVALSLGGQSIACAAQSRQ